MPEAEGFGVGVAAFRASVTARPCVVAVAEGLADDGGLTVSLLPVALSLPSFALPDGEALGVGCGAVGVPAATVSTGRK